MNKMKRDDTVTLEIPNKYIIKTPIQLICDQLKLLDIGELKAVEELAYSIRYNYQKIVNRKINLEMEKLKGEAWQQQLKD